MFSILVEKRFSMEPKKAFWGILLIIVGVILFLTNFNILGLQLLKAVAVLWPIVVIAIGFQMLFKKSSWASLAIWSVVIITLIYFSVFGNRYDFFENPSNQWFSFLPKQIEYQEFVQQSFNLDNSHNAYLALSVASGKIIVREGNAQTVTVKTIKDDATVVYTLENNQNVIRIDNKSSKGFSELGNSVFEIELDPSKEWKIEINGAAIDAKLLLEGLNVVNLNMNTAAGQLEAHLGSFNSNVGINLNMAASAITLKLPKSHGVVLIPQTLISDIKLNGTFDKIDKSYYSLGFNEKEHKITINLGSALGSIDIQHD
jgi:hypothetical protein